MKKLLSALFMSAFFMGCTFSETGFYEIAVRNNKDIQVEINPDCIYFNEVRYELTFWN